MSKKTAVKAKMCCCRDKCHRLTLERNKKSDHCNMFKDIDFIILTSAQEKAGYLFKSESKTIQDWFTDH